jgi:hypothetical protein
MLNAQSVPCSISGSINYVEFVDLMSGYADTARLPEFMQSRVWRTSSWMAPKQKPLGSAKLPSFVSSA